MKKQIAIILALVLMLTVCACGGTENGSGSGKKVDAGVMTLTEVGTVPDGVGFTTGGILSKTENAKEQILNQNGVSFNDKWYDGIKSILTNGICAVSIKDASGQELLGVVDSLREKELVPCEAVEIVKLSDRFFLLGYETGAAMDDDAFGFYFIGTQKVEYKGYGKVLDLENGQLVPNLEITTSKYDVSATGNMILVEKESAATDAYTADGKLAGSYESIYAYPDSGIALQNTKEGICVYDGDLKLVSTLTITDFNERYTPIDGSDEMLLYEFDKNGKRQYCITDLFGNAISAEFSRVLTVYPVGYLHIVKDDINQIVDFEGTATISDFKTARYVEPGYFVVQAVDGGYYVYNLAGKKINEKAMADSNNGIVLKDASGKVLVIETGEVLDAAGYVREQTGSLVLIESTLYDVISGKTVLTDVDSCVATGGSLYVWNSETQTYTRYIAEFKTAG